MVCKFSLKIILGPRRLLMQKENKSEVPGATLYTEHSCKDWKQPQLKPRTGQNMLVVWPGWGLGWGSFFTWGFCVKCGSWAFFSLLFDFYGVKTSSFPAYTPFCHNVWICTAYLHIMVYLPQDVISWSDMRSQLATTTVSLLVPCYLLPLPCPPSFCFIGWRGTGAVTFAYLQWSYYRYLGTWLNTVIFQNYIVQYIFFK